MKHRAAHKYSVRLQPVNSDSCLAYSRFTRRFTAINFYVASYLQFCLGGADPRRVRCARALPEAAAVAGGGQHGSATQPLTSTADAIVHQRRYSYHIYIRACAQYKPWLLAFRALLPTQQHDGQGRFSLCCYLIDDVLLIAICYGRAAQDPCEAIGLDPHR